jgi:ATP-binding cassette, subfamily B, bacterial HlyB/CyaB
LGAANVPPSHFLIIRLALGILMHKTKTKTDTLFSCFVMLARESGIPLPFDLTAPEPDKDLGSVDTERVRIMAKHVGIDVHTSTHSTIDQIGRYPALALLKNGNAVVLLGYNKQGSILHLYDPLGEDNGDLYIAADKFAESWSGSICHLQHNEPSNNNIHTPDGPRRSWIWEQLAEQKANYWLVISSGFFVNIFSLVSPFFLMAVLDKVVPHNAWTTLTVLGVAVSVVVTFESIFDYLKGLTILKASRSADLGMQTRLYGHFIGLPYAFLKQGQKGIWAKTLTEPERIRGFVTNRVLNVGVDLLFVLIFAVALFWMNRYLFSIAVLAAFFELIIGSVVSPLIRHRINSSMIAENRREAFLAESIATIDIIKALGAERTNYRYWKAVVSATIDNRHRLQTLLVGVKGLTGFIDKSVNIIVVWVGAALVMAGETTVGILVASTILSRRITSPIMQLATLINDYHEIKASATLIDRIASQPLEQDKSSGNRLPIRIEPNFELDHVRYRYPGNHVFDVFLDLKIKKNSMVAIVGASGSGKSTLTRLLLGLVTPAEGVVRVDGHDLRNIDFEVYRNQIGTVLQEVILFRGTVKENIGYGVPGATLADIVEAARMAGADEFIQQLPEGYGTVLDESASNISGGQRQRIALARAIVRNPKLLILDEATSALDPESEGIILQNLQSLRRNRTVVIVSHRLSAVVNADLIVWMEAGRIVDAGSHSELLRGCPQYARLWDSQTTHVECH